MKAHEATQLVQQRIYQLGLDDLKMYNKIIDNIKSHIMASERAVYSMDIYENVSEFVKDKLRKDGYTVVFRLTGPLESALNVSWPEAADVSNHHNNK